VNKASNPPRKPQVHNAGYTQQPAPALRDEQSRDFSRFCVKPKHAMGYFYRPMHFVQSAVLMR